MAWQDTEADLDSADVAAIGAALGAVRASLERGEIMDLDRCWICGIAGVVCDTADGEQRQEDGTLLRADIPAGRVVLCACLADSGEPECGECSRARHDAPEEV